MDSQQYFKDFLKHTPTLEEWAQSQASQDVEHYSESKPPRIYGSLTYHCDNDQAMKTLHVCIGNACASYKNRYEEPFTARREDINQCMGNRLLSYYIGHKKVPHGSGHREDASHLQFMNTLFYNCLKEGSGANVIKPFKLERSWLDMNQS